MQDVTLYDARLTRDVLLARAGLLPHAVSLVHTSRTLLRAQAQVLRTRKEHFCAIAETVATPNTEVR